MDHSPIHQKGPSRTLVLVRHGKAAPRDAGLSDFERGLLPRGFRESARVAELLQATGISVNHIISSPADRALETAHVFAAYLDFPRRKIQVAPSLYEGGGISSFTRILKSLDPTLRVVLLCGHNPQFDEIAAHYLSGFSGTMEKSEALAIGFKEESWKDLPRGRGVALCRLLPGPDPKPPRPVREKPVSSPPSSPSHVSVAR